MTIDTNIPQLVFNKMSNAKYEELKTAGQLVDTEFYVTPDNSQTLPTVDTTTVDKVLSNDGTNMLWTNIEFPEPELGYKQLTNCITKIPQNIKFELTDGVLTLKAGSKVYYPDGTSVIIENDIQNQSISGNVTSFIRYQEGLLFADWGISYFSSGITVPSNYTGFFFNTTEKTIYFYNNGIKEENTNCSLPLGIATITSNTITSIDQVFNGFGYIGSTVFALPGIEGLAPNDRNTDYSLNNVKFTTTDVSTITVSNAITEFGIKVENDGANVVVGTYDDFEKYFDENSNVVTYDNVARQWMKAGNVTISNGTITEISPKNPVSILDRNDSSWVAEQAIPSGKYIDLTLGASGTTYTAPANGWMTISKTATAASDWMVLSDDSNGTGFQCSANLNNTVLRVTIPIKKGNICSVYYAAGGTTNYFRFIYAQGEV